MADDENKIGGSVPDQPDAPESNGSTNGSSEGITGTSMGGRQSAEVIRGDGESDAAMSATQSTGESSGSVMSGAAGTVGSIVFGMARLVANGGKSAGRSLMNMGRSVGSKLMTAGAGISSFTGGAITPVAGAAITGGTAVTSMVTVGAVGMSIIGNPLAMREGDIRKCTDNALTGVQAALGDGGEGVSAADIDGKMEDNAKKMWSALSKAGMSDENIAGILANFQRESKLDSTAVESIFDEPYTKGPRKKELEARDFSNNGEGNNATRQVGIGIAQWTNERNPALRKYAKQRGKDWSDLEIQVAYLIDPKAEPSEYEKGVKPMIENTNPGHDDPLGATDFFYKAYERGEQPERDMAVSHPYAKAWYVKMKGWSKDTAFANSVLSLAETTSRQASSQDVQNQLAACPGLGESGSSGGNDSLAEAMATYSWGYMPQSEGNKGTELYVFLHDEIFPGDGVYMSCDRSVATAVRWSGTDDTFPQGDTIAQEQYLRGEGKEKWDLVTKSDAEVWEADKREPGDVIIHGGNPKGHIFMYLGKEAIDKVWGSKPHDEKADGAEGSYQTRSPALIPYQYEKGSLNPYYVFRSKGGEKSSKYKDIKIPSGIKDGPSSTKSMGS